MRDNETMCAHDDAGPYHQHTLKEKKKSKKKKKEVKEKNVHMHISFLIMMDNPGYEDWRWKVSEKLPQPANYVHACVRRSGGYHYQ